MRFSFFESAVGIALLMAIGAMLLPAAFLCGLLLGGAMDWEHL